MKSIIEVAAIIPIIGLGTLLGNLASSAMLAWRAHREWMKLEQQAKLESDKLRQAFEQSLKDRRAN
jgi:hypothetical protein